MQINWRFNDIHLTSTDVIHRWKENKNEAEEEFSLNPFENEYESNKAVTRWLVN